MVWCFRQVRLISMFYWAVLAVCSWRYRRCMVILKWYFFLWCFKITCTQLNFQSYHLSDLIKLIKDCLAFWFRCWRKEEEQNNNNKWVEGKRHNILTISKKFFLKYCRLFYYQVRPFIVYMFYFVQIVFSFSKVPAYQIKLKDKISL